MPGWWQDFFHAPVDLRSLALVRILFGAIVFLDALSYARHARLLFDPDGYLPFGVWRESSGRTRFSLLRWLPPTRGAVRALIVVYGLAGLALSVGLGTRAAAVVAFVAGVSLQQRDRWALHSGDAVLRTMLLLLALSEAGRVWSLDALRAGGGSPLGSPWALRLMQLQLAFLYLVSVRFKLEGRTWRRGTATHYATWLQTHRRVRLPAWLDRPHVHRAATYGTLAAEVAGGTLVWWGPTRLPALAALAALHLSLQVLMRMHLFQAIMLVSLVVFVPGELTGRLLGG